MKNNKAIAIFMIACLVLLPAWIFDTNVRYGNITATGIITTSTIKQAAGGAFVLVDPNGVTHLFIANSAPYTNTFVQGNGTGVVFLGSAALANVGDATGNFTTAGFVNSTQTGGGPAAGMSVTATAPFFGWKATGQAADQKWWDCGANGLQFICRAVNDANSGSATWLTVNRGAGATVSSIQFGANITNLGITGGATNALLRFNGSNQVVNGNTSDDGTNFSTNTVKLQAQGGVTQGSGMKHQRFGGICSTAAAAGATCTTTLTWTSAFADANYTVVCTGHTQTNTAAGPTVESVTASNFVVRVAAITAAAGTFATVDCMAMHD